MKIGIVIDDYKIPKFKALMDAAGVVYTDAGKFTKETTAFTCFSTKDLVQKIVTEVELHYKRSN